MCFIRSRVSHSSKSVLNLVYTDIWGLTPIPSFDGYCHFVIFVNDFSRFIWFYPMKLKIDVYSIFANFHAYVEKLFPFSIKAA